MHFSTALLLYVSSAAAVPISFGTGLGSISVGSSTGLLGGGICLSLLSSSCDSTTSSGTTSSGTTSSGTTSSGTGTNAGTGSSSSVSASKAASSTSVSVSASKAASSTFAVASASASASAAASASASPAVAKAAVVSASVSSSVPKASSTPSAAPSAAPSASSSATNPGASTIVDDLNAFDKSLVNAISALNGFTGGANINSQAQAVAAAGQAWQSATLKLVTDAQSLTSKGQFSASDSSKIVSTIAGSLTTDMVALYNAIQSTKPEFVQVNAANDVHNGLAGIRAELQEICDALTPLLQSADYPALQAAANKIYGAALNALNAYASS